MTEYEKMMAGLQYRSDDDEILKLQLDCLDKLYEFNQLRPSQIEEITKYLKENFAECGEDCYIVPPFHANWGGRHVHMGNDVSANFNLTLVDDGHIYIGDHVLFGPNVTVATAVHPIDAELRDLVIQCNKDVYIGESTWIGAGAIILPGVKIGKKVVIGAGSVVTKDIPDSVVAVGNPCRVLRKIDEHDRECFWKNENTNHRISHDTELGSR